MSVPVLLFFFLFINTQPAYGYIDPGTGSYIIQLLIAAFATLLYTIKYFWGNIKNFYLKIKNKFGKKEKVKKTTHSIPTRPATRMEAKKK